MRLYAVRQDHRVAAYVFVLAFLSFAYFVQGGGPNENSRYNLTRAIVEHRTLSIEAFHNNTFDKANVGDSHYSDKAPGLSFAAVPAHAMYYVLRREPWDAIAERNGMYVATLATVSLLSAAAAAAMYLLLRHLRASMVGALFAVTAWSLGSHALAYSTLFMGHQFVASCLLLAFSLIVCRADVSPTHPWGRWMLAAAGGLAGWAAISEYPAALIAAALFLYALLRIHWRSTIPFVLAALVPLGLFASYNTVCFGSPMSLSYQHLSMAEFRNVMGRGFFGIGLPDPMVMFELLIGEFRGLLPLSPVFVLVPIGWTALAWKPSRRIEAALSILVTLYLWLLSASYQRWDGGAAMGPRYLLPAIPFAAFPLAFAFDACDRGSKLLRSTLRGSATVLLLTSVIICTLVTVVMPELPDYNPSSPQQSRPSTLDPRKPIAQIVVPLAANGLVSQKALSRRGTISLAVALPGHEDDAFNWGEWMGLRGLWSLVPLLLLWGIGAAAIFTTNRDSVCHPADEA
jgi:hypothetical protein